MANVRANRKAHSMKTKTGKTRLGPLSLKQLKEMFNKANRNKDKDKIQRRINNLFKKGLVLKEQEA